MTLFRLLLVVYSFQLSNALNVTSFSYNYDQRSNLIDSIYNDLKINGADSILIYHEVREGTQKGLISWKMTNILYGIVFKVDEGTLSQIKLNESQEIKLKEARSLYFLNEKEIPDTLPPLPWQSTNSFNINIRSFQHKKEREFWLSRDQIYFGKYVISTVGNKCSDVVFNFNDR
jgi:hypothetical protein